MVVIEGVEDSLVEGDDCEADTLKTLPVFGELLDETGFTEDEDEELDDVVHEDDVMVEEEWSEECGWPTIWLCDARLLLLIAFASSRELTLKPLGEDAP